MEILDLREEREEFEMNLLKRSGKTLITLRGNFPGEDKSHEASQYAVKTLHEEISGHLQVDHEETTHTKEGYMVFLLVNENGEFVKRLAMALEDEHPLGRLVDVDVREKDRLYSRADFNLPPRSCYLCQDPAVHCVRSMKHSLNEVREYYIHAVKTYQMSRPSWSGLLFS